MLSVTRSTAFQQQFYKIFKKIIVRVKQIHRKNFKFRGKQMHGICCKYLVSDSVRDAQASTN